MLDFEESSGQRFKIDTVFDFTQKMAIVVRLKIESLPGAHQMHFVDKGKNNAGNNRNFSLYWTPASGGQIGFSWDNPAGSYHEWSNNISLTTGTDQVWYGEIDWTANPDAPTMSIDGVNKALTNTFGTNNADPLTTATQHLTVGGEHGSADNVNNADGLIGEIGIWSDMLGTIRRDVMAKKFSPLCFPVNLKHYIRLVRDLNDFCTGKVGTLSASAPQVAQHPLVIMPY